MTPDVESATQEVVKNWPKWKDDQRIAAMGALGKINAQDVLSAPIDQQITPLPNALYQAVAANNFALAGYLLDVVPDITEPPDESQFAERDNYIGAIGELKLYFDGSDIPTDHGFLQRLLAAGAAFDAPAAITNALSRKDEVALGIVLKFGRRPYKSPHDALTSTQSPAKRLTVDQVYEALDEVVVQYFYGYWDKLYPPDPAWAAKFLDSSHGYQKVCAKGRIPTLAELLSRSKESISCSGQTRCLGSAVTYAAKCDSYSLLNQLIELGGTPTAKEPVSMTSLSASVFFRVSPQTPGGRISPSRSNLPAVLVRVPVSEEGR